MDNKIITLTSTDSFYTHNKDDALRVVEGTALVYIVPWNQNDGTAGRKELIGEIETGKMIPTFAWRDIDYKEWRFAIISKEGTLKLEIMEKLCTNVLKRRFLQNIKSISQQESYETSLIEFYNRRQLMDEVFIQRGRESSADLYDRSANVIKKTLEGEQAGEIIGKNKIYKVMHWACRKKKLDLSSAEHIMVACGDNPTVPDIARLSNLICRSVVLEPDWYHSDCGIIIGNINKEPVACVPKNHNSYLIYTSDGRIRKLDSKIARDINPKAFCIGRALPQTQITKKILFDFAMKSVTVTDIAYIVILGLFGALIGILIPTLNQKVYDDYIPLGEYGILVQMCIFIGTFMIGNLLFSLVRKLFEFRVSCHIACDFQNALYLRVFQLPESFFRNYDSADLAQRLIGAEQMVNQFITTVLVTGFSTIFSLVYLFRMISYSGKLTIAGLVMVLVYSVIVYALNSRSLWYEKKIMETDGKALSKLYQYLNGIEKVRMAEVEERFILEHLKPFSEKQMYSIRQNRISSVCSIMIEIATYIFSMVLYFVIVRKNIKVSTGNFIAFNSAFGTLASSMLELTNGIMTIRRLKTMYQRLKPVLDTEPENEEGKEIVTSVSGGIRLDDVSFSYKTGEKQVLNHFSMEIRPKEYVAIVGPSGCGKSTLLKLMLGFEKPTSGSVFYDNKNLTDLDKHSFRRKLGVVLQNGKLISGSIKDNITITAPGATLKDINSVINAVGLKDDIANMPMGINTVLSESGGTISGGQQQRILIARAIMNHPAILFFDEATSALDNLTQTRVCEHLDTMNVTRVVIAHRLSTIKNCDRIIVVKDGRVTEEGTYDSLMETRGLFYQMASRQLTEE
ncbi:MAG: NHLP bacteriocin export ABC transporter permease/ATPase subunit [Ruminococcus sp.]|nr:NHLP bacteriocin export ABC transporter permease/ATPase subunit [Ruminococcus sp.]